MSEHEHKLDRYDLAILAILAREGRITKTRLAERIHLSVAPCWERVRKLEAAGLIRGYRASLEAGGVLARSLVLVEVSLARHTAAEMRRFEERVRQVPEIVQCHATGGGVDYILLVQAHDIDHYQRLMDALLGEGLAIERYYTYVVTKTIKDVDPSERALLALPAAGDS